MNDPHFWVVAWPYLVGAVAVIGGVWGTVRRVAPVVRRFVHLVDDLLGEPDRPGVPGRPGVMERLQQLDDRTAELRPNGGKSLKDQITRIDQRVSEISGRLRAVERHTCPPSER